MLVRAWRNLICPIFCFQISSWGCKCEKWTFKVNFLCQKSSETFSIFFSLKNTNLETHFLLLTFFELKWCPIFDSSPLIQNSKFNNFLLVCWFLCKNLSNFASPVWKLHTPYCHNIDHRNKIPLINSNLILFQFINVSKEKQKKSLSFHIYFVANLFDVLIFCCTPIKSQSK